MGLYVSHLTFASFYLASLQMMASWLTLCNVKQFYFYLILTQTIFQCESLLAGILLLSGVTVSEC
jgi:hypothetical protein